MVEFKGIEYFRKGTKLRKVNEDPTLLSFLLLFNRGSVEDSPLLTNKKGGAMDYLETVVNVGSDNEGRGPGAKYAENLKNFQDLLFKINTERSMDFYSNHSYQNIADLNLLKSNDYVLITKENMNDSLLNKFNKIEINYSHFFFNLKNFKFIFIKKLPTIFIGNE